MSSPSEIYDNIYEDAKKDSNIIRFFLGDSKGKPR